jgi:hypothetical protein
MPIIKHLKKNPETHLIIPFYKKHSIKFHSENSIYSLFIDFPFYLSFYFIFFNYFIYSRSAQNRLATIRLPYAGPTTGLKSAECRLYERRLLADFRPVVGPAYGSRMVANQIRADRVIFCSLREK